MIQQQAAVTRGDFRSRFLRDVLEGLSRRPRAVPCKWLYDAEGARLFERICELPEYEVTRLETALLAEHMPAIVAKAGHHERVLELGSGAGTKTERLLAHLPGVRQYVPIDISHDQLAATADRIARRFPHLVVRPVAGDFVSPPPLPPCSGRTLVFFPGSTIGNFDPLAARALLGRLADACRRQATLLVGFDLVRDPAELVRAYDDAAGVTAAFDRNLLVRINRELGAAFEVEAFRHVARWNQRERRVEMHLVATRPQVVSIAGRTFALAAGETIVTEHCYKWDARRTERLARGAGFTPLGAWTDPRERFRVELWRASVDRGL
jgi:dimethylhistidine N-methyltransferase